MVTTHWDLSWERGYLLWYSPAAAFPKPGMYLSSFRRDEREALADLRPFIFSKMLGKLQRRLRTEGRLSGKVHTT